MRNKELEELCENYGKIESSTIRIDNDGNSLGYGYVQFSKVEEANSCIAALNGKNIREKILEVVKFKPRSKREKNQCNLYVKNFPANFDIPRCEAYIKSVHVV